MNCFPCFNKDEDAENSASKKAQPEDDHAALEAKVQTFNFRELAMATKNFRQECLLGEGGFGRVFKGTLQATEQDPERVVAVKQLDRNGMQEGQEFTAEVMKLSHLNHANLVNLIGYCADGDQRVLVYEYVPLGSLEQHLLGDSPDKQTLDWGNRMKIASGAANALEYLHEKANPPVIYGDFKPSNVLLNEDYEPKLSDVGLSKFGSGDGATQQSSRMMGTYGYSAPEYSKGGEVTLKSDIYSFGVVLLELITGRRAIDTSRPTNEQNLVTWAQPYFKDPKKYSEMADPRLNKQFPATSINQAVGIAAMCIQDEPMVRPLISDVTSVLGCICMIPNVPQPQAMEYEKEAVQQNPAAEQNKDSAESHSSSSSSDSEDTESRTNDQQSGEHDSDNVDQSEEESTESGSDSENVDQSEEESTEGSGSRQGRAETNRVKSRQKSTRKPKTKGVSSGKTKGKSSRPTVVTFKEPTKSSRYRAGGKSKTKEGSLSTSEDISSESDTEGGSIRSQENDSRGQSDATENGLTSSREDSESDSPPQRPKRKGNK